MTPRLAPDTPDLVWFRGPDAVRFLNDLLSQEMSDLSPGKVARSLLLGPQGKMDHILWVLRGEDEVGLVTDPGRGPELAATLARYRIRVKVDIAASDEPGWLVIGDLGDKGGWRRREDDFLADVSWRSTPRFLVFGERPDLEGIDPVDLELERVESGEPEMGRDVDHATIPQESGLVPLTVRFDKGCFLGQELVARIDSRGHVNRHLRRLRFPGAAPVPGSEIHHGERAVGRLTSSAAGVGLAMVRREVPVGATVQVEETAALVESVD